MTEPIHRGGELAPFDGRPAPRRTIGEVGERLFLPPASPGDRRVLVVSVGLSVLFSALMIPAWLDALGSLGPGTVAWSVVVGIVYTVAYLLFAVTGQWRAWAVRAAMCVVLAGLGVALVLLMGLEHSWVLMFALCVIAVSVRAEIAVAVTALMLGAVAVGALATGGLAGQLTNLVVLGSVSSATALLVRLVDANAELRRTRDQIAALAVGQERERFARDLHDILGHSLTTITVKAGLVRRLLESSGDLGAAASEAGDVERLSRQALADVRATVSGYRHVTLAGELAVANEALRVAGIRAELPHAVDDVHPGLQEVFGHVLREAVTNVVRHSSAGRVTVRLGRNWLQVDDDGAPAPAVRRGNGLRGLEERMLAVGGTLDCGPRGRDGFTVRAAVPALRHRDGGGEAQ
ncbi:sensor histidine kinase [Sphaerisporangium sp. TRM90804]|uniref:sensor histidine kinase n=1 Tax=Sphaerisporangium sp. TRM90804 TaxID=3031113 RepID=UPI00244D7CB3|nr:sensor histidine kinase [Sphaerisporangium sp. TRM90804]MDH2426887.1 sensor histidine kinase [Sphaerisporangium sp. TRM90804]